MGQLTYVVVVKSQNSDCFYENELHMLILINNMVLLTFVEQLAFVTLKQHSSD